MTGCCRASLRCSNVLNIFNTLRIMACIKKPRKQANVLFFLLRKIRLRNSSKIFSIRLMSLLKPRIWFLYLEMVCICIKPKRKPLNVSALFCFPSKIKSETAWLKTASLLSDIFDISLVLLEASYRSISMFSLCSPKKSSAQNTCWTICIWRLLPLSAQIRYHHLYMSKFQQATMNVFFLLCLQTKVELENVCLETAVSLCS